MIIGKENICSKNLPEIHISLDSSYYSLTIHILTMKVKEVFLENDKFS